MTKRIAYVRCQRDLIKRLASIIGKPGKVKAKS